MAFHAVRRHNLLASFAEFIEHAILEAAARLGLGLMLVNLPNDTANDVRSIGW